MLIRFSISNFMNFSVGYNNSNEEFSMLSGRTRRKKEHVFDDGKLKLLKFAAIYGANAAGKTSLVKAIHFMKSVVVNNKLPDGYSELYCKTNPNNSSQPTYLEVEIKLSGKYYAYGFEVLLSEGKYLSEWLVELLGDNQEREIFSRNMVSGEITLINNSNIPDDIKTRLKIYSEDISHDDTVLFLTMMNQNKGKIYGAGSPVKVYNDIFNWFKYKLDVNYPPQPVSGYGYLFRTDINKVNKVCTFLKKFGTGITDYRLIDVDFEDVIRGMSQEERRRLSASIEDFSHHVRKEKPNELALVIRNSKGMFFVLISLAGTKYKTIKFKHNMASELFSINEESDGTVRLLDLLEILLTEEDKIYVLDELDRCLHPSLTYQFVKTYLSLANIRNVQLIVTTHESRLLDFDLLRQDEVWIINKNNEGNAHIYSLDEYNIRFDKKVEKAYLEGRYGGVPLFNTLFPFDEGGEKDAR